MKKKKHVYYIYFLLMILVVPLTYSHIIKDCKHKYEYEFDDESHIKPYLYL